MTHEGSATSSSTAANTDQQTTSTDRNVADTDRHTVSSSDSPDKRPADVAADPDRHAGRVRIARSRGALTGVLLVLLGIWGALIPLVGPYVHFGYTPDTTWHLTAGRFWMQILPGAAVALGGLLLLVAANRLVTSVGAWLAAAGGAWFVVGPTLAPLLHLGAIGTPIPKNSTIGPVLETLLLFSGLGAVILLLAEVAIGRLGVVSVRDMRTAQQRGAHDHTT